jgi:hypothetical protein
MKKCILCGLEKEQHDFYKRSNGSYRHDCKRCLLDLQMNRWKARKVKAVELLGGKCCICGYAKNLAAMDFHHVDPSTKEFVWQKLSRKPWNVVIDELKKCCLLCKNCHAEFHHPDLTFDCAANDCANRSLDEDRLQSSLKSSLRSSLRSTGFCPCCEEVVYATKYCSNKCANYMQRKVTRPTKEQLAEEMNVTNMSAIGRKYGVSDNAVRKWARWYGI